jgi:hypothetical protein
MIETPKNFGASQFYTLLIYSKTMMAAEHIVDLP